MTFKQAATATAASWVGVSYCSMVGSGQAYGGVTAFAEDTETGLSSEGLNTGDDSIAIC